MKKNVGSFTTNSRGGHHDYSVFLDGLDVV